MGEKETKWRLSKTRTQDQVNLSMCLPLGETGQIEVFLDDAFVYSFTSAGMGTLYLGSEKDAETAMRAAQRWAYAMGFIEILFRDQDEGADHMKGYRMILDEDALGEARKVLES